MAEVLRVLDALIDTFDDKDNYLCIGSYNVHQWIDAHTKPNIIRIVDALQKMNIDILGLCEADTEAFIPQSSIYVDGNRYLMDKLGFTDFFQSKRLSAFRNIVSITSKLKIIETDDQSQFVIIQLPSNMKHIKLGIFIVHFDYEFESNRLQEFNDICDKINEYNDNLCLIIMGDFNALKRMDYDEKKWQNIYDVRQGNNWELPKTELIDKIENEYGFKDCLYLKKFANITKDNIDTSRFNTRVDYLFINQIMSKHFDIIKYDHFKCDSASDHKMIRATFKLNK